MRILVIAACPFPWPRGTPVRVHRLSAALAGRGHEIEVATYHLGDRSVPLPFRVSRIRRIRFYEEMTPGPSLTKLALLDPLLARLVLRRCRERTFDLIHAHHIEGLLIARAARRFGAKLPVVFDSHTRIGEELVAYGPSWINGVKRRIGRWMDRHPPAAADHIVTVTDELRDMFVAYGCQPAERVTTVSSGIEAEFIDRAQRARAGAAGRPTDADILYAGNLGPFQGIDLLLRSFAEVHRMIPRTTLTLVTGDDFAPFAEKARALGILPAVRTRAPDLDTLPAELVGARVLVNPRVECSGMPQKLLNYMASGTPIVSFRGSAKLVTHGESALVVDDGDIEGFARAISDLLEAPDLARRLGQAAQSVVRDGHTWEAAADKLGRLYAEVSTR